MIRVYLDNCAYNRPYDDQSQAKIELETQAKLKIQRMIKDQQIELASSYMSQSFLLTNSKRSNRREEMNNVYYFAKADKCEQI